MKILIASGEAFPFCKTGGLGDVAGALGAPPSSPPQAVKGGSCGGEEEDAEFAFTGSMLSATWEFPKARRDSVLASLRVLFGLSDGASV